MIWDSMVLKWSWLSAMPINKGCISSLQLGVPILQGGGHRLKTSSLQLSTYVNCACGLSPQWCRWLANPLVCLDPVIRDGRT